MPLKMIETNGRRIKHKEISFSHPGNSPFYWAGNDHLSIFPPLVVKIK